MSPTTRRRLRLVFFALCCPSATLVALAAAANRLIGRETTRIRSPRDAPAAPVAIVFGAGLRPDGTVSSVLEDRVTVAAALYRLGKVQKLLLSGDHGTHGHDEPAAMAACALALGVPAQDIFLDHAGFDTYDTLYRAREVFGVRRALLVTQAFHLPRALYYARRLGLDATGVRADLRTYAAHRLYAIREVAARVKAMIVADLLRPRPRFLGPAIPIAGDGRVTLEAR